MGFSKHLSCVLYTEPRLSVAAEPRCSGVHHLIAVSFVVSASIFVFEIQSPNNHERYLDIVGAQSRSCYQGSELNVDDPENLAGWFYN